MSDFGDFLDYTPGGLAVLPWSKQVPPSHPPAVSQVPRVLAARLSVEFTDFSTFVFEAAEPRDVQVELERAPASLWENFPDSFSGDPVLLTHAVSPPGKVIGAILRLQAGYGRPLKCYQEP